MLNQPNDIRIFPVMDGVLISNYMTLYDKMHLQYVVGLPHKMANKCENKVGVIAKCCCIPSFKCKEELPKFVYK